MKKFLVLVSIILLVPSLAWSSEKDLNSNNQNIRKASTVEDLDALIFEGDEERNLKGKLVVVDFDETLVKNTLRVFLKERLQPIEISYIFTNEYQRVDKAMVASLLEQVCKNFGVHFEKFKTVDGIADVTTEMLKSIDQFGRFEYGYKPLSDKWQPLIKKLRSNGATVIVGSGKNLLTFHVLTKFHKGTPFKGKLMKELGIIDEYCEKDYQQEQREAELKCTKGTYYHLSGTRGAKIQVLCEDMPNLVTDFDEVIQIDNSGSVLEKCAESPLSDCECRFIQLTQFHDEFKKEFLPNLKKLADIYTQYVESMANLDSDSVEDGGYPSSNFDISAEDGYESENSVVFEDDEDIVGDDSVHDNNKSEED